MIFISAPAPLSGADAWQTGKVVQLADPSVAAH